MPRGACDPRGFFYVRGGERAASRPKRNVLQSAAKMEIKGEHRQETKSPLRAGCGFLIIIVLIGIVIYGVVRFWRWAQKQQPPPATLSAYHYSPLLCEDAFETEKFYENPSYNLTHIDITLKDGCFGGTVTLPQQSWRLWAMQLLHNDRSSWVAFWWEGRPNPEIPDGLVEFNQKATASALENFPKRFRLQGKGTLRIYRVSEQ